MTHEFKTIFNTAISYQINGKTCVLATVVHLEGSSYRKPGVRMLISEDGDMTGAVSGGCVESEAVRQAQSVFESGTPKMMTYDGRYRLGCEGILYILLEKLDFTTSLKEELQTAFSRRTPFSIHSEYLLEEGHHENIGSHVNIDSQIFPLSGQEFNHQESPLTFSQEMAPLFQLIIIGAEHDAVQLCTAASLLGWEVTIIDSPKDPKGLINFPGAKEIIHLDPTHASELTIDAETAVVLMTHSYSQDLKFLMALQEKQFFYLGLLGAKRRREKLFNELIDLNPELDTDFLNAIFGPAGIDIGSVTPQEIAIAIISEILAVKNHRETFSLRNKSRIHA